MVPRNRSSSPSSAPPKPYAAPVSAFVTIYRDSVLQQRTRNYRLPALRVRVRPEILHTLLGIELRLGRKRLLCPDLATARYLATFARIGLREVALPYDITRVSVLADELETALEHGLLLAVSSACARNASTIRGRKKEFLDRVRTAVEALGSKPDYPEFEMPRKRLKGPPTGSRLW